MEPIRCPILQIGLCFVWMVQNHPDALINAQCLPSLARRLPRSVVELHGKWHVDGIGYLIQHVTHDHVRTQGLTSEVDPKWCFSFAPGNKQPVLAVVSACDAPTEATLDGIPVANRSSAAAAAPPRWISLRSHRRSNTANTRWSLIQDPQGV